jgi:hypothetical protein
MAEQTPRTLVQLSGGTAHFEYTSGTENHLIAFRHSPGLAAFKEIISSIDHGSSYHAMPFTVLFGEYLFRNVVPTSKFSVCSNVCETPCSSRGLAGCWQLVFVYGLDLLSIEYLPGGRWPVSEVPRGDWQTGRRKETVRCERATDEESGGLLTGTYLYLPYV